MTNNINKSSFPATTLISFFKVVESLQELSLDKDPLISTYAKRLVDETRQYPELIDGFEDYNVLSEHKDTVDKLVRTLFPSSLQTNEIKGVIPPFQFEPFYVSERFQKILEDAEDFSFELDGFDQDKMYIYGCIAILGSYFGYDVNVGMPTYVDIPNKKNNTIRTYRLAFNADLMEIIKTERSKDISAEDYKELLDNFENIELWKEKFPPNSWIMRGVGIANFMDVTIDRSINQINSNILIKSDDSFEKVTSEMKVLFNSPDLKIGFLPYQNEMMHKVHKAEMNSIILGERENLRCQEDMCPFTYDSLIRKKQPLVISDTKKYDKESKSTISNDLIKQGIGSFIIAPIVDGEEIVGFIELASPHTYKLNGSSLNKLDLVLPTITIAANRFRRESQNLREAIIQQECTTIHSSVKWRFEEEADRYIASQERNEQPIFSDIVFKDVNPLYGQIDIKGSSVKRNEAVKNDLLKQLKSVKKIMDKAIKLNPLPIYEELNYRIESLTKKVKQGLISGTEREVLSFLNTDIYPVFEHLGINKDLRTLISDYFESLEAEMGSVYEERKSFDESINQINYAMAEVLDKEQEAAQKMFPHYFERFKTDGVEFDMYIGQSISNNRKYDPIYLQNLRLWQLIAMTKMERKFNTLKKELNTDLDVTSMILVYNSPISVHFRTDEKRFDVEGSYNARYEIVKKRIDKSTVKGKPERINQPGKLAIVYSSENDALEYRKYLNFLEAKGYIKRNSLEVLELEDLQGISGLWALRVELNFENTESEEDFSVEKILESIKN